MKDAAQGISKGAAARGDPDASPPPAPALRLHMKDGHVKDAAQDVEEDVPQDVAQDLGFGARARAPSSPRHHRRRPVFVQFALRWGRWAAQWHLARAAGKRFRGCRAKRLYVSILLRR